MKLRGAIDIDIPAWVRGTGVCTKHNGFECCHFRIAGWARRMASRLWGFGGFHDSEWLYIGLILQFIDSTIGANGLLLLRIKIQSNPRLPDSSIASRSWFLGCKFHSTIWTWFTICKILWSAQNQWFHDLVGDVIRRLWQIYFRSMFVTKTGNVVCTNVC